MELHLHIGSTSVRGKLGAEHHDSAGGPTDVLASDHVAGLLPCRAEGAERCGGQQRASVPCPRRELACCSPMGQEGLQGSLRPAQMVVRVS